MYKIYYLSTCDTCRRIMKEIQLPRKVVQHDVKTAPLAKEELEKLRTLTGSYEALVNKRAIRYKEKQLPKEGVDDEAFKDLILEHYTLLKRPVLVLGEKIFIGNSRNNIEAAKKELSSIV